MNIKAVCVLNVSICQSLDPHSSTDSHSRLGPCADTGATSHSTCSSLVHGRYSRSYSRAVMLYRVVPRLAVIQRKGVGEIVVGIGVPVRLRRV